MVEGVPALLDVVQISLSPSHARDLHEEETTLVDYIIPDDGEVEIDETELGYADEVGDSKVDNLLRLINEDHNFGSSMFSGGVTKADILRMIEEAKEKKNAKGKQKKSLNKIGGPSSDVVGGMSMTESDLHRIADIVASKICGQMKLLDHKVNESVAAIGELKYVVSVVDVAIGTELALQITKMKTDVIDGIWVIGALTRDAFETVGVGGGRGGGNGGNCSEVGDNGSGDVVEENDLVNGSLSKPVEQSGILTKEIEVYLSLSLNTA
ncbi:unnamed protein product [Arabis nemorensis]|uniref:Uncharacterized protein n=1 Tax=Arabis nemorensis TaxID=586526 RepID=A0A565ANB3_9BRAS|nr:unnamed protein product [Arabis nemorensis]